MFKRVLLVGLSLAFVVGCGSNDDPTSSGGSGTEKFTTWGEDYIETGIPSDPDGQSGFVNGWSLHYDKFLVNFHAITIADHDGNVGAKMEGSRFVDNTKPGRKDLVSFDGVDAKAWEKVSYQIKPALADAVVVAGDPADLAMMAQNGYSIYVEGSATTGTVTKTFHWGFTTATQYNECHHEEGGKDMEGVVVTNGGTDTSELTTHGDHFYYDRLQASPDPAVKTRLRFDLVAKADDDGNGDGEVTLEELDAEPIDVNTYDPSGFSATKIGEFIRALARTVGHFRGEGECTISAIQ